MKILSGRLHSIVHGPNLAHLDFIKVKPIWETKAREDEKFQMRLGLLGFLCLGFFLNMLLLKVFNAILEF